MDAEEAAPEGPSAFASALLAHVGSAELAEAVLPAVDASAFVIEVVTPVPALGLAGEPRGEFIWCSKT